METRRSGGRGGEGSWSAGADTNNPNGRGPAAGEFYGKDQELRTKHYEQSIVYALMTLVGSGVGMALRVSMIN
jgi:hypothetical protein